jgi:hypothetical protein
MPVESLTGNRCRKFGRVSAQEARGCALTRACIMAATQHLTERSLSNGYGIARSKTIT